MKKFNYLINFEGNHDFFNSHSTWHDGLRLTLPDGFHLRSVLSEAWDVPTKYIWSVTTRNMILETWSLKSEFHKNMPIDYRVETKRTEDCPSIFSGIFLILVVTMICYWQNCLYLNGCLTL